MCGWCEFCPLLESIWNTLAWPPTVSSSAHPSITQPFHSALQGKKTTLILKRQLCAEQQLGGSTKHKAFPLVQHAWLTGSVVSVSSVAAAAVWPNIFTVVAILWLEHFYCKNNFTSSQKSLLKDGTKGLDPNHLVSCCHQTNMFTSCSWKSNCFYSEVLCHHDCGEMLWFVDKQ